MANLYEIDKSILACIDAETGEMIDPERLESLFMERNQKIENIALWIKNLQADAMAYSAEKTAFDKREKAALAKVEALKKYLAHILQGEKFSTAKCAVSFRRSEKVQVDNVKLIPAELLRVKTTVEADKDAIKKAIKAGQQISGCRLLENMNAQIE